MFQTSHSLNTKKNIRDQRKHIKILHNSFISQTNQYRLFPKRTIMYFAMTVSHANQIKKSTSKQIVENPDCKRQTYILTTETL